MTKTAPLDVKVIFSASSRSRGRRGRSPLASVAGPGSRLVLLGLLNLVVAGVHCYGVWWWQNPTLIAKLYLHSPMLGVDPTLVDQFFDQQVPAGQTQSAAAKPRPKPTPAPPPTWTDTIRAAVFPATMIGWEVLSTVAILALALSGGVLVGWAGRGIWRTGTIVFVLLALCGAAYAIYAFWDRYQRVTPSLIRTTVGTGVILTAMIGLIWRSRIKGFSILAAILLIVAAAGTAGALYVAARYDAVPIAQATPKFLTTAFGVHSLWGWVLLVCAWRIPR